MFDIETDIIQLELLNRNFHQTVKIKKYQEIGAPILLKNGYEHYKLIIVISRLYLQLYFLNSKYYSSVY